MSTEGLEMIKMLVFFPIQCSGVVRIMLEEYSEWSEIQRRRGLVWLNLDEWKHEPCSKSCPVAFKAVWECLGHPCEEILCRVFLRALWIPSPWWWIFLGAILPQIEDLALLFMQVFSDSNVASLLSGGLFKIIHSCVCWKGEPEILERKMGSSYQALPNPSKECSISAGRFRIQLWHALTSLHVTVEYGMLISLFCQCKQQVKEEIPLFFCYSKQRCDFIQFWCVYLVYYPTLHINHFLCTTELSFDKVEVFFFSFFHFCQKKTQFNCILQTAVWFWHIYFMLFLVWPQAATASVLRFPTGTSAVCNSGHQGMLHINNLVLQTALSIWRRKKIWPQE